MQLTHLLERWFPHPFVSVLIVLFLVDAGA